MGGCCSKEEYGRHHGLHGELECRGEEDEFYGGGGGDEEDDHVAIQAAHGGARVRLKGSCHVASMHTQQGWKGVNQDAMTIWEDFGGERDAIFCGVFDDHGPQGHKVASHVRDALPVLLYSELNPPHDLQQHEGNGDDPSDEKRDDDSDGDHGRLKVAYVKAFEELDKELGNHSVIDCICSGTTAVSILKQGENLTIANLGDSRAVLCIRDEKNRPIPIQLTVDLKPNVPSEEERIMSCKGRVFALEEEPDVHRMWLPDEDSPGLAMSRAFGDFCLKDFGLISTPIVSNRKLSDKDEFVVLATDGVWDVLSNKEVVKIVFSASKRSDAAKILVDRAVRAWRSKHPTSKVDDCAVICLFLKELPSSGKTTLDAQRLPKRSRELSTESFMTARSASYNTAINEEILGSVEAESKEEWTALEGVSRVNSLLRLPRFARILSWRKRSVKEVEEDENHEH